MLRMDQVHVIRHKVLREGLSVRAVARQLGLSRNTVAKYLQEPEPRRQERTPRPRPTLERVAPRIEELLQEWQERTTAKQRLTGARLHRQLVEEGYQVGITTVRDYLWEKRRQAAEVYIPLVHRPGEEGQVDFFQVTVDEGECRREVWKFLLRLPYSGRDFLWLYDRCDQLSFLAGHVRAAEYLWVVCPAGWSTTTSPRR
jgi:transposase